MSSLDEHEFNLDGWGNDKRLIEGPCGHCHHAVAFKNPQPNACQKFEQKIVKFNITEVRTHFFVMGICPRPNCQKATIVYREELVSIVDGYEQDPEIVQERVIFPISSRRPAIAQEVPEQLRALFHEAATIEHLSPNGSAFLARRILEQILREHFKKPKGKLAALIEQFLQTEDTPADLHLLMTDIREFGNIACHPAQDEAGQCTNVESTEATYTLDVVAELLDFFYVKPIRQQQMRERWQAKKDGKIISKQSTSAILLGGRDKQNPLSKALNDDDLPF